jgi:hypothetical protein
MEIKVAKKLERYSEALKVVENSKRELAPASCICCFEGYARARGVGNRLSGQRRGTLRLENHTTSQWNI